VAAEVLAVPVLQVVPVARLLVVPAQQPEVVALRARPALPAVAAALVALEAQRPWVQQPAAFLRSSVLLLPRR